MPCLTLVCKSFKEILGQISYRIYCWVLWYDTDSIACTKWIVFEHSELLQQLINMQHSLNGLCESSIKKWSANCGNNCEAWHQSAFRISIDTTWPGMATWLFTCSVWPLCRQLSAFKPLGKPEDVFWSYCLILLLLVFAGTLYYCWINC